jgi:hypothetical protein
VPSLRGPADDVDLASGANVPPPAMSDAEARRIARRLAKVRADDPVSAEALALLTGWEGDLRPDSAPGARFEV